MTIATRSKNSSRAVAVPVPLSLALLLLVSFAALASYHRATLEVGASLPAAADDAMRRLSYPAAVVQSDGDGEEADYVDDPADYVHLVISYHRTGHDSAFALTNLIKTEFGTILAGARHNVLPPRSHDISTGCPNMEIMRPGKLYVQAAPDLFCNVRALAEELLHHQNNVPGRERGWKGVKIVHLVRNPFKFAVGNYRHLTTDRHRPTPRGVDPCDYVSDPVYPQLLMPTLGGACSLDYADFDGVLDVCRSLFRTRPGLERKGYDQHLQGGLDPAEGLLLATVGQIRGYAGDLARMASNVVKLRQLKQFEEEFHLVDNVLPKEKRIQVLTLDVGDFDRDPGGTASRFLTFLLGEGASLRAGDIESVSERYGAEYLNRNQADTIGAEAAAAVDEALEASLRGHELFGRILGNIERVLDDATAREG